MGARGKGTIRGSVVLVEPCDRTAFHGRQTMRADAVFDLLESVSLSSGHGRSHATRPRKAAAMVKERACEELRVISPIVGQTSKKCAQHGQHCSAALVDVNAPSCALRRQVRRPMSEPRERLSKMRL